MAQVQGVWPVLHRTQAPWGVTSQLLDKALIVGAAEVPRKATGRVRLTWSRMPGPLADRLARGTATPGHHSS